MVDFNVVYQTQEELYKSLISVLRVKERVNRYYGYDITGEMMWNYLSSNKWCNDKNLSLAQVVNDIIVLDIVNMRRKMIVNE